MTRNRDAIEKVAIGGFPCVHFCQASNYKPSFQSPQSQNPGYSEKQSHFQMRKTTSAQLGPQPNLNKTTLVCNFELAPKLSRSSEEQLGEQSISELGSHHKSSVSVSDTSFKSHKDQITSLLASSSFLAKSCWVLICRSRTPAFGMRDWGPSRTEKGRRSSSRLGCSAPTVGR